MTYNQLATNESLNRATESLSSKGYTVETVKTGSDALERIKNIIPEGASVMNGGSTTLDQIGYLELLKTKDHKWNNLKDKIVEETDPEKQNELRKNSVVSDYYLGSVHAVTESGDMVFGSNTGSQLPHIVFTSTHLIFVVSTQKIVPTLADAMNRLEEHVVPLEDKRALEAYGANTALNKILIVKGENAHMGRSIQIIFVEELLGF